MTDKRELIFIEPASCNRYITSVIFWGRDGDKHVRCEIDQDALADHFGLYDKTRSLLKAFESNKVVIEHEARRKYLAHKLQPDGSVFIKNEDL